MTYGKNSKKKFGKKQTGDNKKGTAKISGAFNPYGGKSSCVPKTNNSPKTKY